MRQWETRAILQPKCGDSYSFRTARSKDGVTTASTDRLTKGVFSGKVNDTAPSHWRSVCKPGQTSCLSCLDLELFAKLSNCLFSWDVQASSPLFLKGCHDPFLEIMGGVCPPPSPALFHSSVRRTSVRGCSVCAWHRSFSPSEISGVEVWTV